MTPIILPNNHVAVTVPEGAHSFRIDNSGYLLMQLPPHGEAPSEFYPDKWVPGSYTLVGMASEITEEQAGEIINKGKVYGYQSAVNSWTLHHSASDALDALLRSVSLEPSNTIIIKQNK